MDHLFPSLEDFNCEDLMAPFPDPTLSHVTRLTTFSWLNELPFFEKIPLMPRVRRIVSSCSSEPAIVLQPFEHLSLTSLKLNSTGWTSEKLKAVLTSFPNLTDLELNLGRMQGGHDEPVTFYLGLNVTLHNL